MKTNNFFALLALSLIQAAALLWVPLWWSGLLISFLWALSPLPKALGPGKNSLLFFFLAGALSWGLMALWFHLRNQGLLTVQMGELFHLPATALLLITALLGGVLSMLGGVAYSRSLS
ncbi:MAG TPA: hypothetical protein ENJ88_05090 [Phaeodactylibacter sp.]|nr:hypothetical protein [Phaeodactylibacter sp.]